MSFLKLHQPLYILLISSLSLFTTAFPHLSPRLSNPQVVSISVSASASASATISVSLPTFTWSPTQLVDINGAHAYQDPLPGQARGPCPAQNALANHGYLDRSGYTSLLQCVTANSLVFNMGEDIATYLCFLAQLVGGDLVGATWSIGNSSAFDSKIQAACPSPGGLLGILTNLVCYASAVLDSALGTSGFGMAQTHNSFEADSSFLSFDWGLNGIDASTLDMNAVKNFWKMCLLPDGTFDYYDCIIDWATYRMAYCIGTNPCYMRVPQATIFASLGAYSFMPPLFSNYTAERPNGTLTQDVFASWFGVTRSGSGGTLNLKGKGLGKERIPDNWYHRPIPYTTPEWLGLWYSQFFQRNPSLSNVGGNTNGVNTFSGLDIGNLTGGVINGENLLQGDNFVCFYYRVLQIDLENKLPGAVGGDLLSLGPTLGAVVDRVFGGMMQGSKGVGGCPVFGYMDIHGYGEYCGVQRQPGGIY